MDWKKLGRIFVPDGTPPLMRSHAANPVAESISDQTIRIYFNSRDPENRSSIFSLDFNLADFRVEKLNQDPALVPGEVGTFDDSGVSLGCITNIRGRKHLYYVGWNLSVTVPWRNSIGVAIYNETKHCFEKLQQAPILDRSPEDPFSLSYPYVLPDQDGIRMWYGSNLSWGKSQEQMKHVIKYAESGDGINWRRDNIIAIDHCSDDEYAIARPSVMKDGDVFRMWYVFRGEKYRIGYAESPNGIDWTRKDDRVGISTSSDGWDSQMVCYPHVFDHRGARYMLYNGNGYGQSGFGLAILEKQD